METYFGLHTLEGEWHSVLPRYLLVARTLLDKKVLELGCGNGIGTALLCHIGVTEVVAVDHRPDMIRAAAQQFSGFGARFVTGIYDELDLGDDKYDVILCLNPEVPIGDPAFLTQLKELLSPGGTVIASWPEPGIYGLEKVLPRLGDTVEGRPTQVDMPTDPAAALMAAFSSVKVYIQVPELAFAFARGGPLETRTPATDRLHDTNEFDVDAARKRLEESTESDGDGESGEEGSKDGDTVGDHDVPPTTDRFLLSGEQRRRATHVVVVCADDETDDSPSFEPVRVELPYYGVATRLGQLISDFYRHLDDAGQSSLLLEAQLEDKSRLVDDLEEELRSQRELSRDQAQRLGELHQGDRTEPNLGNDLAFRYARLQAELASRDQEILEATASFNRQILEYQRSLHERDAYIENLAVRIHHWEEYTIGLQRELEARELALENLGQVLERRDREAAELRLALSEQPAIAPVTTAVSVPIATGGARAELRAPRHHDLPLARRRRSRRSRRSLRVGAAALRAARQPP